MLKNSFLILAMLFATNIATHAQNAEGVTKNLSFYICGASGNVNPDTGTVLNSSSETGISFSQNFANAQWFNVSTTLGICTEAGGMLTKPGDAGNFVGSPKEHFYVTGYGKINMSFGKYFAFGINTIGRFDFDVKYKLALADNQGLTFRAYMELLPTGNSFYATPGNGASENSDGTGSNTPTRRILNHFDVRLSYSVGFHPEWSFDTDMRFRFNGGVMSGSTAKADSMQAMKESFSIRWNNTINYSNPNGFGGYFQFRYQPDRILVKTVHNVSLHGGISYAYDLSAL